MVERIHSYPEAVIDPRGARYRARAEGEQNEDGRWQGWLVFEPETAGGPVLRTSGETTQADREDLAYWASGLEPAYLDGALTRARPASSGPSPA